jgi:uncharacterized protein YndB with AHSA1/START domain
VTARSAGLRHDRGEVAATLGLRQPQATKHLHTLARAGLVTVHPLGQRRIYALERKQLRALRAWLDGFDADHPSEDVLEQYRRAIEAEHAQAVRDPGWAERRVLSLSRSLPTSASVLWRYWTSAQLVREWWAPEHFTVADCELDAVAGGRLRIVMQEADGSRHTASGRFLSLDAPRTLSFELAAARLGRRTAALGHARARPPRARRRHRPVARGPHHRLHGRRCAGGRGDAARLGAVPEQARAGDRSIGARRHDREHTPNRKE